jgi:hypothetical protein
MDDIYSHAAAARNDKLLVALTARSNRSVSTERCSQYGRRLSAAPRD